MSSDFDYTVPVCTTSNDRDKEFKKAKDEQRPFVVTENHDDDLPGWRARYDMNPTGEDREEWYFLSDDALKAIKSVHDDFQQFVDAGTVIEGCSNDEGALHGLSKSNAKRLADEFAEIVWDKSNWEEHRLEDDWK